MNKTCITHPQAKNQIFLISDQDDLSVKELFLILVKQQNHVLKTISIPIFLIKFGNVYYPLAEVIHKHEQGSYKNPMLLKAHLRSAWQYFNKWGWFFDQKRREMNDSCLQQFMS